MEIMVADPEGSADRNGVPARERTAPAGVSLEDMMRRTASLLLLISLVATGAAPLAGERLVCPMPMASPDASLAGSSCEACAMDSPAAPASLEAATCCSVVPATESESAPATVSAQRRGGASSHPDGVPVLAAILACPEIPSRYVPSFDSPALVPAPPPPLSTQTTHLRN